MSSAPVVKKAEEYRREFPELPNVVIQDPARDCAYYLNTEQLARFEATADTWMKLDETTVTFVIPDGDMIDEVPPYLRFPELRPSVLIRYARGESAYFLSFNDLQEFKIQQPRESFDPQSISFIIPRGTEMIEELPALRRALLQSNTQ